MSARSDGRALLAAAAVFALDRTLLVVTAADRLGEPDLAETKLMTLGDAWVAGGLPSWAAMLELARQGANAPHGAFLPTSLLYGALAQVTGGGYGTLKAVAVLTATVAFVGWVAAAGRLGGRRAAAAAALMMVALPAGPLGASLIAWGSHPEAAALLGVAAAVACGRGADSARGAVGVGLVLGLPAAASLLLGPVVALLAAGVLWDAWTSGPDRPLAPRAAALAVGVAVPVLVAQALVAGASASVVESAGQSPLELLAVARAGEDLLRGPTLAALLPPPIGRTPGAWEPAMGAMIAAGALAAVALGWRRLGQRGRLVVLAVGVPALHALVLATLAPRRPYVPPRYLLAVWPAALLGVALVAQQAGRGRRLLAAVPAVLCALPGLALQADLIDLGRAVGFAAYEPGDYVAAEIGHVTYATAPQVNGFLAERREDPAGFGLAAGLSGADSLLLADAPRRTVEPADVLQRRAEALADAPRSGAARDRFHHNLGWGLGVFAADAPGVWLSVLERADADRDAIAEGIGRGLHEAGEPGCERLRRVLGPDRDAMLRGAQAREPVGPVCRSALARRP